MNVTNPQPGEKTVVHVGCRPSILAETQTNLVITRLSTLYPSYDFRLSPKHIFPAGDRDKITPFQTLSSETAGTGTTSLWTTELEDALIAGELDILVHSFKDVPTTLKDGCSILPVLEREDRRDVLVVKIDLPFKSLEELPPGSVVGTNSARRVAQLKRRYPALVFMFVRGNVDTRLEKLDSPTSPYAALILAAAGLIRLSLQSRITAYLSPPTTYPAVAQGYLGAEFRNSDNGIKELLNGIADWKGVWAVHAERVLLAHLGGGCAVPIGVWTTAEELDSSGSLEILLSLSTVLTSLDGSKEVEFEASSVIKSLEEAENLGNQVALALMEKGGRDIMAEIRTNVPRAQ